MAELAEIYEGKGFVDLCECFPNSPAFYPSIPTKTETVSVREFVLPSAVEKSTQLSVVSILEGRPSPANSQKFSKRRFRDHGPTDYESS